MFRTFETTEVTEKHSVSSKKQIKRRRLGRWKIDSWVEDEVIFEVKGLEPLPRIYESQAFIYSRRGDKRAGLGATVQQRGEGIKGFII